MDNSEFATSMGNKRKDQNKIQDLNDQMQFKDNALFYPALIKKVHCVVIIKKESVPVCKQELTEFHNILIVLKVEDF